MIEVRDMYDLYYTFLDKAPVVPKLMENIILYDSNKNTVIHL